MVPFLGRGDLGKERAMRLAMAGKLFINLNVDFSRLDLWFSWNQRVLVRYGNHVLLLVTPTVYF